MGRSLKVLLGVSGGIAAVKSPELVRSLRRNGHEVRCALSPNASAFVAPLSLEVLSGAPVRCEEYLEVTGSGREEHIELGRWPDVFCVAPATCHTLASLALGLADNFLTTTALVYDGPVVVAPAMSSEMWAIGEPERFEEMMAFWADGAEGFFVGEPALFNQGVRVISTMEDMLSFSEGFVGGRTRTNFFPQENYVAVYSPTLAVQVTQQHFSVTNNDGETGSTFPMSSTTLWVLEEGAWKIAHHHQSWTNDPVEEEEEG